MAAQSLMCILFCGRVRDGLQRERTKLGGRRPMAARPQPTLMSLHVARSSSCALSLALRTTRRSSSLSLSEEPMRKRLAPFLRLDPLLDDELPESESELELPSSACATQRVHGRPSLGVRCHRSPCWAAGTYQTATRRKTRSPPPRSPPRSSWPPRTWTPARACAARAAAAAATVQGRCRSGGRHAGRARRGAAGPVGPATACAIAAACASSQPACCAPLLGESSVGQGARGMGREAAEG